MPSSLLLSRLWLKLMYKSIGRLSPNSLTMEGNITVRLFVLISRRTSYRRGSFLMNSRRENARSIRTNSSKSVLMAFSSMMIETIVGSLLSVLRLNSELIDLSMSGFFLGRGRTRSNIISGSKPNSTAYESMLYSMAKPPMCLIMIMGRKDSTGIDTRDSRSPAHS